MKSGKLERKYKEVRSEGRKEGRKKGRKEKRKEGKKEGRKEGRKEDKARKGGLIRKKRNIRSRMGEYNYLNCLLTF